MPKEIEAFQEFFSKPQSFSEFGLNLLVGLILALILQWHFRNFSSTLSNRQNFSKIFIPLVLVTVLIISVVKSSLALSLGLVGALSIVRFRTPIKEPEELIYLFLCIAIGLGLGASQTVITVFAALTIMIATALISRHKSSQVSQNVFFTVALSGDDRSIESAHEIVNRHADSGNLRRLEMAAGETDLSYMISVSNFDSVSALTKELEEKFENVRLSFIDQDNLPRL